MPRIYTRQVLFDLCNRAAQGKLRGKCIVCRRLDNKLHWLIQGGVLWLLHDVIWVFCWCVQVQKTLGQQVFVIVSARQSIRLLRLERVSALSECMDA